METECVLGISASAIVAVSGVVIVNKRVKIKNHETQEQSVKDALIAALLPEVMSFYQLEMLGKDPFTIIDCRKLVVDILDKSTAFNNRSFDRQDALIHMQEIEGDAKEDPKALLVFLFWYLDFANGIIASNIQATHSLRRETIQLQKQIAVWYISYEELEEDAPDSISELIRNSVFYTSALKEIQIGVFREMMADDEMRRDRRGNLVRIIFRALEKESDGQMELSAIHQFHEHYDKRYTHRNKGKIHF